MKNFLPFAARETLILAAGETKATSITSTAYGSRSGDSHVVWQDFCIWNHALNNDYNKNPEGIDHDLFMRYGLKGRGYLIDRPIPVGVFSNAGRPMVATWRFERPYTLWPGEELTVRLVSGGPTLKGAADPEDLSHPAVMFSAVRVKDGHPHSLYAADTGARSVGFETALRSPFLKCPSDSPVRIYGVSHHFWYGYDSPSTGAPLGIEVFGPGGKGWLTVKVDPATTVTAQQLIGAWIDPPSSLVRLGVEYGWRVPSYNNLVVELENRSASAKEVVFTARGSVEVEEER